MATLQASPAQPRAPDLSREDEERLLDLARAAVRAAVRGESARTWRGRERDAAEGRRAAVFVTLLEDGELRGCIGTLDAGQPLSDAVPLAAMAAAVDDWRFNRVAEAELASLEVDVSVLGPLRPLDEPTAFLLGVDGIVVERGGQRGLLLPEVATTNGLDRAEMLEAACRKAGLPRDAWRDPRTRVSAFRTRRFGGPLVPEAARTSPARPG